MVQITASTLSFQFKVLHQLLFAAHDPGETNSDLIPFIF